MNRFTVSKVNYYPISHSMKPAIYAAKRDRNNKINIVGDFLQKNKGCHDASNIINKIFDFINYKNDVGELVIELPAFLENSTHFCITKDDAEIIINNYFVYPTADQAGKGASRPFDTVEDAYHSFLLQRYGAPVIELARAWATTDYASCKSILRALPNATSINDPSKVYLIRVMATKDGRSRMFDKENMSLKNNLKPKASTVIDNSNLSFNEETLCLDATVFKKAKDLPFGGINFTVSNAINSYSNTYHQNKISTKVFCTLKNIFDINGIVHYDEGAKVINAVFVALPSIYTKLPVKYLP